MHVWTIKLWPGAEVGDDSKARADRSNLASQHRIALCVPGTRQRTAAALQHCAQQRVQPLLPAHIRALSCWTAACKIEESYAQLHVAFWRPAFACPQRKVAEGCSAVAASVSAQNASKSGGCVHGVECARCLWTLMLLLQAKNSTSAHEGYPCLQTAACGG